MTNPNTDNIQVTIETPTGSNPDSDARTVTAANDPNGGRPTFLLDKFKSVEDQAKAYVELQKLLGRRQAGESEANIDETDKTPVTPETPKDAPPAPKVDSLAIPEGAKDAPKAPAKLDIDAMAAELEANGSLSDESKALLESKGVPESVVIAYQTSKATQRQQAANAVMQAAGGAEGYQQLIQWAKQNLSESEIKAFNKTVTSGDVDAAAMVVAGLASRAKASSPNLVLGGNPGTPAIRPFENEREMLEAFQDPRYRRGDPEFTRKVQARMSVTNSWR